jgi:hypothetical protein
MEGPLESFANELDNLVSRWRGKPLDDRLSFAELVGTLTFKAHTLMSEVESLQEEE